MSVIVTGAAGAIGSAIVEGFADQGTRVVAQDLRSFSPSRDDVIVVDGDLRDDECLTRLRAAVAGSGAEAVVAAHGVFAGSGPLETLERESTCRLMEINFAVLPKLLEALLDPLRARSGVFVAIASQAALRGEPDASIYSASKWAVRAWAEATDRQLRDEGVRVRSVCPGRTASPLLDGALETFAQAEGITREAYEEHCRSLVPAGRFGSPEEIAAAVRFLAAPQSRPNVLAINGGEVPW